MAVTERVDRRFGWSRLPKPAALVTLMGLRMRLRRDNLFDPAGVTLPWTPSPLPEGERPLTRSADGTGNDLTHPEMGSVGALFGRNVPPDETAPLNVLTPNPRAVSLELLTRAPVRAGHDVERPRCGLAAVRGARLVQSRLERARRPVAGRPRPD